MSRQRSPFTHRRYPLTMVCATYRVARTTVYAQTEPAAAVRARAKRGPKTGVSDTVLVEAMALLEQAFAEHECLLTLLRAHEFWEPLHADTRFADLVRRVGIPDCR